MFYKSGSCRAYFWLMRILYGKVPDMGLRHTVASNDCICDSDSIGQIRDGLKMGDLAG